MLGRLLQPEIRDLIEARDWRQLREVLVDLSVPDVADILPEILTKDRAVVFRMLPRDRATEVFEHLEPEDQELLLESLKDAEVATYLNDMSPDDRTVLLEEMPDRVARRVMRLLSPEERKISELLLAYPEQSVGRLVTPDYLKVKSHLTVGDCLRFVRRVGEQKEMVDYIYIVDESNRPLGVVSLRELVFARDDRTVSDLIQPEDELVRIRADSDQEEAVQLLKHYDVKALPVVDTRDHLVGIVTFDDLMDVQEEEATEDMHLMSGVVPTEATYRSTRFFSLLRNRLGALLVLGITAVFAGTVLQAYEAEFEAKFANLVLFIIALMAVSGNTGSQVGTLIIRALAIDEMDRTDLRFVVARELLMGVALGIALGAVVGGFGFHMFGVTVAEAMTAGSALAMAVVMCNMVGVLLPIGLHALKQDPAFFANPLITTISDFLALFIFFETARQVLA